MKKTFAGIHGFLMLIALMMISAHGLSQTEQVCTIAVTVMGEGQPAKAVLLQVNGPRQSECEVEGNTVLIRDTLMIPLTVNLLMSFKEDQKAQYRYPLYLQPGVLSVKIDRIKGERGSVEVQGPKYSCDFSNLLEEPINNYNLQLNNLREKLHRPGQDTAAVKQEINRTIHACFSVPRNYLLRYPGSLLDIIALKFMGSGDPTLSNPAQELEDLFHSLDPKIQNSEAGINYFENLQKIMNKQGEKNKLIW
jgi:hypothetical protein